jgi:protein gp37
MPTKIEWCDETWNPITGCTPVSEGCEHCYAQRMAHRLAYIPKSGYSSFGVQLWKNRLDIPMSWRKPRMIFVCSMGDIFHDDVWYDWIEAVFQTIANAGQHTYLFLTKRPENMRSFFRNCEDWRASEWPHVWLGVTAENQQRADERIPILLDIPAALHFVSVEPMLGPVSISRWLPSPEALDHRLDWVICGGETGQKARQCEPSWVRSLSDQCHNAGVPYFAKKFFWKAQGPMARKEFP